ncbi:ABC transporter substrate-binding protein [Paracoccus contaminans]|uniref:ABC transporter substrate-binding protein n=1 Tax=Paracoccus contaminans TaxID=1945662 RepID=UPI001F0B0AB3|nr:ABC transporter substrate-binding protein [Paracoccus contaminans]
MARVTAAALALAALAPAALLAGGPARVVSMNLCTDELALLLAAPGQLVSVSALARDPRLSAVADRAAAFPVNHGHAEEVFLLHPDLVLAGSFGGPPVAMLQRLGVPVMTLDPPRSIEDVRQAMLAVGAALGRQQAAAAMLSDFDARLARLSRPPAARAPAPDAPSPDAPSPDALPPDGPVAASWGANGYTAGADTLPGDLMRAAGFSPLAERLGMTGSGSIPLEMLVLAQPALIVTGTRYPRASRAEEIAVHPVLERMRARRLAVPDAEWTCAVPQVADALGRLAGAAKEAR